MLPLSAYFVTSGGLIFYGPIRPFNFAERRATSTASPEGEKGRAGLRFRSRSSPVPTRRSNELPAMGQLTLTNRRHGFIRDPVEPAACPVMSRYGPTATKLFSAAACRDGPIPGSQGLIIGRALCRRF